MDPRDANASKNCRIGTARLPLLSSASFDWQGSDSCLFQNLHMKSGPPSKANELMSLHKQTQYSSTLQLDNHMYTFSRRFETTDLFSGVDIVIVDLLC